VPSSIKHIHHHHRSKVILQPEKIFGDGGWVVSKGLENLGGGTEEHVLGHNLAGSHQEDLNKNTGWQGAGQGRWHDGKFSEAIVFGSGNAGGLIKQEGPHIGLTGRNLGGVKKQRDIIFSGKGSVGRHPLKGQEGDLGGVVQGKFVGDGAGVGGSKHGKWQNLNVYEGGVITSTIGSDGHYEVQEQLESEKGLNGGAFLNTGEYVIGGEWDNPVIGHSGGHTSVSSGGHPLVSGGGHSSVSSSEVKGHTGTSYSTFVLHERPTKDKRRFA